jgi:hypothetical protein
MKALALVVTFAIGLGLGALGTAARLSRIAPDSVDERDVTAVAHAAAVATSTPASQPCADEAQLRRVVREELMAAAAASVVAQGSPDGAVDSPAPASSQDQIELVNRRVDEYIRAGVISDSEMTRLQRDIATLDPAARRAAMQKLVRAMNSGALDGRL